MRLKSLQLAPFSLALFAILICRLAVADGQQTDNNLDEHSGANWARQPIRPLEIEKTPDGLPTPSVLMPHAGDYVSSERYYYELVYMPLQTRIYAYDRRFRPVGAKDVRAVMTVQLQSGPQKVAFEYVPQPQGSTEQDYVAANFDARPLLGQALSLTFELQRLADRVVLSPYYAHFNIRPYLAKALVTPGDKDAIARQGKCPVTGAPLGSRGPVVKIYVAEYPLYLSGDDCIAAVSQAPQRFVPHAPPPPISVR